MKLFDASGGSTKIVGIAQIWAKEIKKNGNPNFFSGVSAGSILSLPFAIGKITEVLELMNTFDAKTIFDKRPLYDNGLPTPYAVKNFVVGKNHLGTMNNLEKNLKKIITEKDYYDYRKSDKPTAVVMATRYTDKKNVFFNLKQDELTYNEAIKCILASSSIAGVVPPVEIMGNMFYDGGYRDHSIGAYMIRNYDITECVSVFARAYYLDKKNNDNLDKKEYSFDVSKNKEPKNIKEAVSWGWTSHISEVSLNDENEQIFYANEKNIKLTQYFLPNILNSLFDTNRERLNKLILVAKELDPDFKNY